MTKEDTPEDVPFDLDRLRELIELMEKHGLTEVNLKRGDEKWRLRRGPQEVYSMVPPPNAGYPPAPIGVPAAQAPPAVEAAASAPAEAGTVEIVSPTVGTFYASPTPDDPVFVKVGDSVKPDTVVCIVEAMKVFNQIPAEVSGAIVSVLVKNGDPVEFGQPLFHVRPG